MSEAVPKVELPPVELTNKYDATQIKNAVDDEIARYYTKEQNFVQSHTHTDIRLLLGYVSCFIAGGAFYYEYKTSFREAIPVTMFSVISFWILQALAAVYQYTIEKDEVFMGSQYSHGREVATLKVSGKLEKYNPKYSLKITYVDKTTTKETILKVEPNATEWFTTKGILSYEAIDNDLKKYVDTLKQQLHQE
ncbi:microsomal signal peptidase 25 kDa subunit [Rhizopus microsporus var. microsporus]|uniref:Signal peptidase complex subunit 2 n=1 Tax=Rhizopus microsporus var. microsporus TaxID=86635 RepID=A0A1X0QQF9_RHIZD|nr:microsomal signal peptidase 25 kDa subunit [Rhizopus microsporus var. microsporus]